MDKGIKRSLTWSTIIGIIVILSLLVVGCQGPPGERGTTGATGAAGPPGIGIIAPFQKATAPEPVVEAVYTKNPPVLDGIVDKAWEMAKALSVPVKGDFITGMSTTGQSVTLKFLYTNEDIYMLAQWADPTWSWSRSGWLWGAATRSWSTLKENSEDRIGVLWNINVPDFAKAGCATKCHAVVGGAQKPLPHPVDEARAVCATCHGDKLTSSEDGAYFTTQGIRADSWHMKAARTVPIGYSDDKYVSYVPLDAKGFPTANKPDGGRYADSGIGFEDRNRNAAMTAPLYIETSPKDYADAMVITQSEIALGEAVSVAGLTPEQVGAYWAKYAGIPVPAGASPIVVPERILKDMAISLLPVQIRGSRADLLEAAKWSNGIWTAEFARKLVTGHDDDVQFDDFTKVYLFDVALMDNTGGEGHSFHVGTPLHLVFAPPTR